jgi:hypothetical protein
LAISAEYYFTNIKNSFQLEILDFYPGNFKQIFLLADENARRLISKFSIIRKRAHKYTEEHAQDSNSICSTPAIYSATLDNKQKSPDTSPDSFLVSQRHFFTPTNYFTAFIKFRRRLRNPDCW